MDASSNKTLEPKRHKIDSNRNEISTFSFQPATRVASFGPTVWHEFSPLAVKYGAVNLGQGFPNFEPPEFVLKAGKEVMDQGSLMHQYTRSGGHPRLVHALAKTYSPLFGRTIDPMKEICISVGASEGLFATILALVDVDDEVVMIEPFFDIYEGAVKMAHGILKVVSLRPQKGNPSSSDWTIDLQELRNTITPKTKLLLLNNPHNPTGKVFTLEELKAIAEVVKDHPKLIVISDEVYEWMFFGSAKHERFAKLPGMFERTLTVGSAGKTFSVTGWKVGWIIGPEELVSAVMKAHQYIPFSVVTPLQEAVAIAFEQAPEFNYFESLRKMYEEKRNFLVKALRDAGLDPIIPDGSYFVIANTTNIQLPPGGGQSKTITGMELRMRGWNFCRWLTTEIGVAAIPLSSFCLPSHKDLYDPYVRFCFCKTDEVLSQAKENLKKLLEFQK